MIQAVYDILSSPANLHAWGKSDSPACLLCLEKGSINPVFSSCTTALGEGSYCWWHNQVRKTVAEAIYKAVANNKLVHDLGNVAQINSKSTHLCIRLGAASQLGEVAQGPGPCYDNFVEARHGAIIRIFKADTYRAERGKWAEALQVSGAGESMPEEKLEGMPWAIEVGCRALYKIEIFICACTYWVTVTNLWWCMDRNSKPFLWHRRS